MRSLGLVYAIVPSVQPCMLVPERSNPETSKVFRYSKRRRVCYVMEVWKWPCHFG